MTLKIVLIQKKGRVCTLTLNRPKVMNAMNLDLVQDLRAAVNQVAEDADVRVIVFQGAGDNFCAGADVAHFIQDRPSPEWLDGMQLLAQVIRRMPDILEWEAALQAIMLRTPEHKAIVEMFMGVSKKE